jgi:hypothetical protein
MGGSGSTSTVNCWEFIRRFTKGDGSQEMLWVDAFDGRWAELYPRKHSVIEPVMHRESKEDEVAW